MSTGWNTSGCALRALSIINLLGNEYWLEPVKLGLKEASYYKPTGK